MGLFDRKPKPAPRTETERQAEAARLNLDYRNRTAPRPNSKGEIGSNEIAFGRIVDGWGRNADGTTETREQSLNRESDERAREARARRKLFGK